MKTPIQRIQTRKKQDGPRRLLRIQPAKISPLTCSWGSPYFIILCLSLVQITYGFDRAHCNVSLGMESRHIRDEQISVSSSYVSTVGRLQARINNEHAGGAWCPKPQIQENSREYIEIDFLETLIITSIATQGRHNKGRGQEYVEDYMIEYYRPKIGRWIVYQRWDGKQVLKGNTNTNETVRNRLEPVIVATKIRVIPYSAYLRTVCLRLEFYGCHDPNGLLSYTAPPSKDDFGDLNDSTYDGTKLNDGTLVDGLGRLTDGQVGADSFTLDVGQGRGTGWVAWEKISCPQKYIALLFEFTEARNFTEINVFANNFFSKGSQVFSRAVVYYHFEGMLYETAPMVFHTRADLVSEKARNVSMAIPGGALAKLIKFKFYFAQFAQWVMIGEVYFASEPIHQNVSLENLKLFNDDMALDDFENLDNISPEQGSLTIAYDVYLYIQSTLCGIFGMVILLGLGYIVFYLLKNNGQEQVIRCRRRLRFPNNVRKWMAWWGWGPRPSHGDPEAGDSSMELEQIEICIDPEEYPNQNSGQPRHTMSQLSRGGYVTRIVPNQMIESNSEIAVDYTAHQPPEPNEADTMCTRPIFKNRPHTQSQSYNIDRPTQQHYYNNGKYYSSVQINEVSDENVIRVDPNRFRLKAHAHGRRVSFSNVEETGGFDEYANQRRMRDLSSRQGSLGDKIEHLFNSRQSMSIRDKIQVGPDHLWNIGVSDSASSLPPEEDVVHIPIEALTFQQTFSCYLGREISFCSTEKLRRIMNGVSEIVMIRVATPIKNTDSVDYAEEVRTLASLRHPTLWNIIGVVSNSFPPIIIQEYSPGKDLCILLRNSKQKISFSALISIVAQICCCMRYLETKYLVHRDLAARNCVIFSHNRVKVGDLAMYSNYYKSDYYHTTCGRRLPLRWMSWEGCLLGRFTNASAVWSFAITAWEIFGHCNARPYTGCSNAQIIALLERLFFEKTSQSNREVFDALPKPPRCPTELYKLLKQCWHLCEERRPSFDDIYRFVIQNYHEDLPLNVLF